MSKAGKVEQFPGPMEYRHIVDIGSSDDALLHRQQPQQSSVVGHPDYPWILKMLLDGRCTVSL
jgi:hypothetical protein